MTTSTITQPATLRQYVRYDQIDQVTIDSPLWLHITFSMLSRYSHNELKRLGSGQGSKMRMIARRVRENYVVTDIYGIDQRVDDNKDIPLETIRRDQVTEILNFIDGLDF